MTHDLKRMLDVARNPTAAFDYEVAQEIASALGRLGRALETALAALQAYDEKHPATDPTAADAVLAEERRALVASAGHALWQFTVQREACGLRDTRQMLREYRVPAEVQRRMGMPLPQVSRPARRQG